MTNNLPDKRLSITKVEILSVDNEFTAENVEAKAKYLPTALLALGALLQTRENQDNHIIMLTDRFKVDEKQFGYYWACCLLIKNIISDRRHIILRALKLIAGIIGAFFALPYAKDILPKIWKYLVG